jgi:hypothetical protein
VATTAVSAPGYSILNTRDEPTSPEEIRKVLAPRDQSDQDLCETDETRFTFTKIGGAAAVRSIITRKSLLTRRAWASLIDYLLFVNNTEL